MNSASRATGLARELRNLFDGAGDASAVLLAGTWYVVTTGTGDGVFAYDLGSVEDGCKAWRAAASKLEEVGREHGVGSERYEAQHAVSGYPAFCDAASPNDCERIAVAAYLRDDTILDAAGTCTSILSGEARRVLDIAKELA